MANTSLGQNGRGESSEDNMSFFGSKKVLMQDVKFQLGIEG